jgi:hypothetical protein
VARTPSARITLGTVDSQYEVVGQCQDGEGQPSFVDGEGEKGSIIRLSTPPTPPGSGSVLALVLVQLGQEPWAWCGVDR